MSLVHLRTNIVIAQILVYSSIAMLATLGSQRYMEPDQNKPSHSISHDVSQRVYFAALAAIDTTLLASAVPTEDCPNLGPAFVHDFDLKKTKAFKAAEAAFPEVLETLFSSGAISKNTSTFSIDVFSTATNESVYSYHHIAPDNNATLPAGNVDDESIYRIGSVSKLYTAYAILAAAGIKVLDRPVTDYVPELLGGSGLNTIDWDEVTIGALMSQQGGVGGFPIETTSCYLQPTPDCPILTVQDFLGTMRDHTRPTTLPFSNPLYSDASWGVLGVALERLSGLPYNDALHELLGKPLGLNGTSSILPPEEDLNAVILPAGPSGATAWGLDNPISAASGGVYSNNADLRALGISILQSSLLSPAATREWLKPRGNTGTLTTQVGAPWEINRLSLPIAPNSTRTRVSDLYTKLGGQPQYAGVFALSPDHGLGYSILIGGPSAIADRAPLRDAVGEVFVTAAEHAALENAEQKFTGTFVDEVAQGANITLTVDQDRPGLGLQDIYLNGTNLIAGLLGLPIPDIPAANVSVRLYPMGVEWRDTEASDATIYSSYRAFAQVVPGNLRADVEGGEGLFDHCVTWQSVGFFSFGGVATDEFVFGTLDGELKSVSYPFGNATFLKV